MESCEKRKEDTTNI